MSYLEECIHRRLTEVENRIAKGKGVWPGPGYIKDDDWAHLQGQYFALRHVFQDAGLEI